MRLYCIYLFVSEINATDSVDLCVDSAVSSSVLDGTKNHMTVYYIVLITVVFIVFVMSPIGYVVYKRLFAQNHRIFIPTYNKELKPLHVKERPIVLLLYARDCDVFMNIMAEFRSVLKSSLKCQVSGFS